MRSLPAILFAAAVAIGLQATAGGMAEVMQRMKERIARITPLMAAKTVGEDNRGFLSVLGEPGAEAKAVVKAENADRELIYRTVAAKTGATVEEVGKRRAKKLAGTAVKGVMIQAPDGTWYEKK